MPGYHMAPAITPRSFLNVDLSLVAAVRVTYVQTDA